MKTNYRKIWENHYGKIPKDEDGRPYEIHHKDGNRNNNDIENLICISIKEHYDIHYQQGDYGACVMIAKRMNLSPNYLSEIQKGVKRPGIGGVKKGTIPWNKGKKGYKLHNEETLKKISANNQGENNPRSKITEKQAKNIISLYLSKPFFNDVGKIMKNFVPISYYRLFSLTYSNEYFVTPENITRIIKRKTWKNLWKKIEDTNV